MRDAQILILDEPTAALDAQAEHDLFARIKDLTKGKMALYIHTASARCAWPTASSSWRTGRLVEQGTHDELMLQGGRYADLFDLQAASYR